MGGFGEYFAVDAVVLRVVFLFFVLVTGFFPGVLAYIIAIFIIPEAGEPIIHTASEDKVS